MQPDAEEVSHEQVFETHPEILDEHNIIVIECTFMNDEDLERASVTKHMHWKYLEPIVCSRPNTLFVLTHFSLKYKALAIRRFFQRFANVHCMLVEDEVEEEYRRERQSDSFTDDYPSCRCIKCREIRSTK